MSVIDYKPSLGTLSRLAHSDYGFATLNILFFIGDVAYENAPFIRLQFVRVWTVWRFKVKLGHWVIFVFTGLE